VTFFAAARNALPLRVGPPRALLAILNDLLGRDVRPAPRLGDLPNRPFLATDLSSQAPTTV